MPGFSSHVCFLLAEGPPVVNAQYVLQVASRAVHILSAVILAGGLFYMRTVLAPAGKEACFAGRRAIWARWVGIATMGLLATGIYNLVTIIQRAKLEGVQLPPTYFALFGVKLLLALSVMFIAALLAGKTEAADRFRNHMGKWLNLSWLAVMAIIVIAVLLETLR